MRRFLKVNCSGRAERERLAAEKEASRSTVLSEVKSTCSLLHHQNEKVWMNTIVSVMSFILSRYLRSSMRCGECC